jgi:hypothetical protein
MSRGVFLEGMETVEPRKNRITTVLGVSIRRTRAKSPFV